MAVALVRRAFHKHPFLFNCMVHGTLYTGTDFSQQTFRKLAMHSGLRLFSGACTIWYKWLDKHYVGTAAKTVVKKLLLDQFLFTPPLIAAFYITKPYSARLMSSPARDTQPTYEFRRAAGSGFLPRQSTSSWSRLQRVWCMWVFAPSSGSTSSVGTNDNITEIPSSSCYSNNIIHQAIQASTEERR
ncbi:unnamed protein product [Timema podura]|uniref:Mpv17-like protein n=1 Tax=Timema podura TaxID=61482 RepID=A0ABN7NIJ3_TIMPD|nr:unnamed protein product [Timema podura]